MLFKAFNILFVVSLIALDIMDASADYNITSSFYYYDGKVFRKYYISNNNGSIKLMNNPVHLPVIIDDPDEDVDDPTDALAVAMLNHCDSFGHCTDDDNNKILIKSSKLEVLVIGVLTGTVTIVLLLVFCIILVIHSNKFTKAAFKREREQRKSNPVLKTSLRSRAGTEDVKFSQPSAEPSQQVSNKASEHNKTKISAMSYPKMLTKLCESIQTNRKLIRLLISKTDSALESKANTASLENELDELQKNMSKWKNNAQKLKMESDHHKRQESYLEERCEELIKHNENLMNFFKIISEQRSCDHTDEVSTDDQIPYPVQEDNPCHQNEHN